MINVSVRRNREKLPVTVEICGHALFAEHGRDIVCAAVSMLVQTVVFALDDFLAIKEPFLVEEGYFLLSRPSNMEPVQGEKYDLLVDTMLLGLKETARAYGDHVTYREEPEDRLIQLDKEERIKRRRC